MATYTQLQTTRLRHYKFKDKKITIWKEYTGENEEGCDVSYWKKYKTVWAYYRQTSGREIALSGSSLDEQQEDAVFTINYYDWLNDTGYRLSYKGRVYNISRIDEYNGERRELDIYARWDHNYTEKTFEDQAAEYEGTKQE